MWEFELLGKMLDERFLRLDEMLEKIGKGFVFGQKKKMEPTEFLKFIEECYARISSSLENIQTVFAVEIKEAIGALGEKGDAIKIKNAADIIYQILNEMVEFEIDINKVQTPRSMTRLINLMNGWAKEFIDQFRNFPIQLKEIYTGQYKPNDNVVINLKINSFSSIEEISILLKSFTDNPLSVWDDEEDYK